VSRYHMRCFSLFLILLLSQLVDPFILQLTLGPSESAFDETSFLTGLEGRLNVPTSRFMLAGMPQLLASGHRILQVQVSDSSDTTALKRKAMMLPFGNREIAGFRDVQVSILADDASPTPSPQLSLPSNQPSAEGQQILLVGLVLNTSGTEYVSSDTITTVATALQVSSSRIKQEAVDHGGLYDVLAKPWVHLHSSRAPLTTGVNVIFSFESQRTAEIDAALMRTIDLPWTVANVVAVGAGVVGNATAGSQPQRETPDAMGQRSAGCGVSGRHLCLSLVVNKTSSNPGTAGFKTRLAHVLGVGADRLRLVSDVSFGPVSSSHPSWAHLKIDKGTAGKVINGTIAMYAVSEGDPSVDYVIAHLVNPMFHEMELIRVSAGVVNHNKNSVRRKVPKASAEDNL